MPKTYTAKIAKPGEQEKKAPEFDWRKYAADPANRERIKEAEEELKKKKKKKKKEEKASPKVAKPDSSLSNIQRRQKLLDSIK